ncbi:hypothetical protein WJX84_003521 [Apatococcus fuscideae]|uniref:Uncharacterized protein n=1 Tax=Apatococcus fuscideae TaxID=2026836 RepID=A0AAW1T038_9CHLO
MPGPRKRPRKPPAPRQQGVTAQEILITCQEVQPLLEGLQESVKAEIQRLEVEDHQLRQQLKLYQADEDHALARPDSSQIGQPHTSCGSTHGEAVQYKRPSGDCISDLLPSVNAAEPPLPDDANEPVSNNQEAGQHAVQRASAPLMTSATASLGRPAAPPSFSWQDAEGQQAVHESLRKHTQLAICKSLIWHMMCLADTLQRCVWKLCWEGRLH